MSDIGDQTTPVPDNTFEDDPAVMAAVEAAMAAARAEALEKARKAREVEKARRAAEEKRVAEARRIAEEREREEVERERAEREEYERGEYEREREEDEEAEGEEEAGDVGEATTARAAKGKGKAAMSLGYVLFRIFLNLVTNTSAVGWCATDVACKAATTATGRRRRSAERAAAVTSPVRWVGKAFPGVPVQRSPGLRSGRGSRRRSGRRTPRGRRRRGPRTVFSVIYGRTCTCWGSRWRIGRRRRHGGSSERRMRGRRWDGEWSGRRKGLPVLDRGRRRGARERGWR
jgi:hypothetical protein